MRGRLAVGNELAFFDLLTFEDTQVTPFRNQLFVLLTIVLGDYETLLTLGLLAKAEDTGNLGKYCRFFRFTGFKQIGNTWQTTGDVGDT